VALAALSVRAAETEADVGVFGLLGRTAARLAVVVGCMKGVATDRAAGLARLVP